MIIKVIHRLFQYLDYKKVPHTRFEKELGLSNGYLKTQLRRDADLGETNIRKVIDYCLEIDPLWLLTGKGEMLKSDVTKAPPPKPDERLKDDTIKTKDEMIKVKDEMIKAKDEMIKAKDDIISSKNELIYSLQSRIMDLEGKSRSAVLAYAPYVGSLTGAGKKRK